MSIKTDNYIRFFKDQVEEIKKEYNKTKAVPMRQLFREDVLTLAYVDGINLANGHITIKVRKGFAPRLKVMKNFTIVSKKARETLGAPHNWNLSFEDFNYKRDLYDFGENDYYVTKLEGFDNFSKTQHVEVVTLLEPKTEKNK